jgi:dUTP pyrophosphatase
MEIRFLAEKGAIIPEYKTEGAAGADICAFLESSITIKPSARKLIPTGIRVEIPSGYEIQVRPRSGLALKYGVTVLNAPGTIDSDYRGEIGVVLVNLGSEDFTVNNGDRIAQLVFAKCERGVYIRAAELNDTFRGDGGYGSTGKN